MYNSPSEFKKQIDEEFYDLHEFIISNYTNEEYISFNEEKRREILENYFQSVAQRVIMILSNKSQWRYSYEKITCV